MSNGFEWTDDAVKVAREELQHYKEGQFVRMNCPKLVELIDNFELVMQEEEKDGSGNFWSKVTPNCFLKQIQTPPVRADVPESPVTISEFDQHFRMLSFYVPMSCTALRLLLEFERHEFVEFKGSVLHKLLETLRDPIEDIDRMTEALTESIRGVAKHPYAEPVVGGPRSEYYTGPSEQVVYASKFVPELKRIVDQVDDIADCVTDALRQSYADLECAIAEGCAE